MKTIFRRSTGVVFCLLAVQLSAQPSNQLAERVDHFLTAGTQNGFAGTVILRVKGQTMLAKGYGFAQKHNKTPNTLDTVFDIGSNTKQFTGAAVLKLIELDKVRVNQTLSDFFADLPQDKQNITVQHLLAHEAGFIESIDGDFAHIPEKDFFKQVFATQFKSKPGEKYGYSNIGYSILAKIIERASGQSYEAFLHNHFFSPLNMNHTGYLLPQWAEVPLAHGYPRDVVDAGSMVGRYREDKKVSWNLLGNGGINTTANDLLKWINGLKNHRVLSKRSFSKLLTLNDKAVTRKDGSRFGYVYGWGLKETPTGKLRLSHNGSNSRFAHSIIWYPETDDLIVFATNTDSPELEDVAYQIDKALQSSAYQFSAIVMNPYKFVFNFVENHNAEQADQLMVELKSGYAKDLASPALLNRIGMMLLDMGRLDWSVKLLENNVDLFPKDGNLHDSLGEAYYLKGQVKQAALSFQKALALGTGEDCYWCKNSQEKLTLLKTKH